MHPHLAQFKFLVPVIVPKARSNAFIEQAIEALRTSVQNERPRFCNAQPTSVVPNAAALAAVAMGQTQNQAELPSPSTSAAGSGSLQTGGAQQPRLTRLAPRP